MIEEKLSKINETIPKVTNSNEEKYNIYNEVKNSECNEYDKHHKYSFSYKKLIPIISCFIILLLALFIIKNYQDNNKNLPNNDNNPITNNGEQNNPNEGGNNTLNNSSEGLFVNNQYCEEIKYEEWMDDIEIKENNGEEDMIEPLTTLEAYFSGLGIYDVTYSNEVGYYLIVYVNYNKVKTITIAEGCELFEFDIKDLTVLSGSIKLDYKKNIDNLLFVKCTNESKIPSQLGEYYPVQAFYVHNVFIKEELFSSMIINKESYIAEAKRYVRTDNEYLVPVEIPDESKSIESVIKGQNAIIISDNIDTILNKKIIKLHKWSHSNQLFYNDYIVFGYGSLGLKYFFDIEYDFYFDENSTLRTNVSDKLESIFTQLKTNLCQIQDSKLIFYHKRGIMDYYYDLSHYYNDPLLTYLNADDYKDLLREIGKTIDVDYNIRKVTNNNPTYVSDVHKYLGETISTYEEYLEAVTILDFNKDTYNEEFFENNNIIIFYDRQILDVLRSESIIRIMFNDKSFNVYANFLILEFDKSELSIDDYILSLYKS